jgi:quercetin dioxygenase-like cupin family protein
LYSIENIGRIMDHIVISFADLPWQQAGPNRRMKEIVRGRQQLRQVEFQKGFKEDGWCESGHVGYVVEGTLDIEFPAQTVRAKAGDGVWIPAGYETRHRAHVVGESAQLILFEDIASDGNSN